MTVAASPITYTLNGFPLCNQLQDPPSDPYPDNNQRMNCVPASLAAGASWLLKRVLYGNELKDAVYGVNYQGPQAAVDYVSYLAGLGIALTPYNNTSGAGLVAHIHTSLAASRPVIITMPSQWGIPYPDPLHPSGYTHVGIMCGWGPMALRCMNPWGGFWQDGSDSYWIPRLCMGQVWDMALMGKAVRFPMVPQGWKDDGTTLTAPNGVSVTLGFRDHVLSALGGWAAWDWPLMPAAGRTPVEVGNPSLGSGTYQVFRSRQLSWTQARGVFETWTGQELLAVAHAAPSDAGQLAAAEAKIAAAKAALS